MRIYTSEMSMNITQSRFPSMLLHSWNQFTILYIHEDMWYKLLLPSEWKQDLIATKRYSRRPNDVYLKWTGFKMFQWSNANQRYYCLTKIFLTSNGLAKQCLHFTHIKQHKSWLLPPYPTSVNDLKVQNWQSDLITW